MNRVWIVLFTAMVASLLNAQKAVACTTFWLDRKSTPVVGKSYDWDIGYGLVLFNKKNVAKTTLPTRSGERTARWVSRHASLTFNQYGREMPNGGINDAGLVLEIMWLKSSRYPKKDDRPAINELQWIQYQLDTHSTVAEMVKHASELRMVPISAFQRTHHVQLSSIKVHLAS